MEWLNGLAAELPVPRNDEPPELRTRIVKEVADHLRCAFERELQFTGDETEAIRRVLAKFGDPARLVRKLWFEAMWGKIMSQRILMGLCGVMTAACLAMGAFTWKIAAQATEATRAVLDQGRAANEAMLECSRAWQESLILKLDSRSESQLRPTDHEWVRLKIKLAKDLPDGPPADSYLIRLTGGSGTNELELSEKSGTDGILDCGLVRAGGYQMQLQTPWEESLSRKFYVRAGQPEYTIAVACPSEPLLRFEAAPEINWPVEQIETAELGILLTWMPAVHRNVAGQSWDLPNFAGNPMMYLVKNDGSIWCLLNDQYVLGGLGSESRLCDPGAYEKRDKKLQFVAPAPYVLHGVVIFPPGSKPSDNIPVQFLPADGNEQHAVQPEVTTTGARRIRISIPDELVARVREKIAELAKTEDVSKAPPDEQP